MLVFLFFCAVIVLSVELLYVGKVIGFFQKGFAVSDITKLLISSAIVALFLALGNFIGKYLVDVLAENSAWYASTILFILGIKLFYDGVKMHKVKQLINPIHSYGLIVLSLLVGMNSLFVGASFGLMQVPLILVLAGFCIMFAGILFGYSSGLKLKKLNPHRYEFLLGVIYIIIAVIFITKF